MSKVVPDDRIVNAVSGLAVLGRAQLADQGMKFFPSSWYWNRYHGGCEILVLSNVDWPKP